MTKSATFVLIIKNNQILLQKRQNTGYMDGYWDLGVSGHVESGETVRAAAVRESLEEIGMEINPERLTLVTVLHNKHNNEVYYNFYFVLNVSEDEKLDIYLNEPNKIADLKWFDLTHLPVKMSHYNQAAIQNYLNRIPYGETGW